MMIDSRSAGLTSTVTLRLSNIDMTHPCDTRQRPPVIINATRTVGLFLLRLIPRSCSQIGRAVRCSNPEWLPRLFIGARRDFSLPGDVCNLPDEGVATSPARASPGGLGTPARRIEKTHGAEKASSQKPPACPHVARKLFVAKKAHHDNGDGIDVITSDEVRRPERNWVARSICWRPTAISPLSYRSAVNAICSAPWLARLNMRPIFAGSTAHERPSPRECYSDPCAIA